MFVIYSMQRSLTIIGWDVWNTIHACITNEQVWCVFTMRDWCVFVRQIAFPIALSSISKTKRPVWARIRAKTRSLFRRSSNAFVPSVTMEVDVNSPLSVWVWPSMPCSDTIFSQRHHSPHNGCRWEQVLPLQLWCSLSVWLEISWHWWHFNDGNLVKWDVGYTYWFSRSLLSWPWSCSHSNLPFSSSFKQPSITRADFLHLNCLLMDVSTQVSLSTSNWLGACVAVEPSASILQQIKFNKRRSKQAATWVIILLIIFVTGTHLPDPLHRVLIDDESEKRQWCIVRYPPSIERFNSINLLLHNSFRSYQTSSHIPALLVTLSVPRLMLAFLPGCMKSTDNLWIYLAGYFVSFVPPLLTFPIFVLPSRFYRKEFGEQVKRLFEFMCGSSGWHQWTRYFTY